MAGYWWSTVRYRRAPAASTSALSGRGRPAAATARSSPATCAWPSDHPQQGSATLAASAKLPPYAATQQLPHLGELGGGRHLGQLPRRRPRQVPSPTCRVDRHCLGTPETQPVTQQFQSPKTAARLPARRPPMPGPLRRTPGRPHAAQRRRILPDPHRGQASTTRSATFRATTGGIPREFPAAVGSTRSEGGEHGPLGVGITPQCAVLARLPSRRHAHIQAQHHHYQVDGAGPGRYHGPPALHRRLRSDRASACADRPCAYCSTSGHNSKRQAFLHQPPPPAQDPGAGADLARRSSASRRTATASARRRCTVSSCHRHGHRYVTPRIQALADHFGITSATAKISG